MSAKLLTSRRAQVWVSIGRGIVLLGTIAAIGISAQLNQSDRKQAEAQQRVSALLQAEQTYFAAHKQFTDQLALLGSPVTAPTKNYTDRLQSIPGPRPAVIIQAIPVGQAQGQLKGFIGITASNKGVAETLLCKSQKPIGQLPIPTIPSKPENPLACPAGMLPVR
jgi:type II secretory pathway pseudopilin PulG